MRVEATSIIQWSLCLFLSVPIHGFDAFWEPLLQTLNQERICEGETGLDASVDLLAPRIDAETAKLLWPGTGSAHALSLAEAVLNTIATHPVTSPSNAHQYDKGEQIGFCFGRALAVHYLLLKAGVSPCDIFKIFAMGALMVHHQIWHFHVAVVVRDAEHGLFVVDPSFAQVLSITVWMKEVERYDMKYPHPTTKFYMTDPRKFLPSPGPYDAAIMGGPLLCDYFTLLGHLLAQDF